MNKLYVLITLLGHEGTVADEHTFFRRASKPDRGATTATASEIPALAWHHSLFRTPLLHISTSLQSKYVLLLYYGQNITYLTFKACINLSVLAWDKKSTIFFRKNMGWVVNSKIQDHHKTCNSRQTVLTNEQVLTLQIQFDSYCKES